MIFSRIGSSLSRSSRFRNVINGANRGRSIFCNKEKFGASDLNGNFKQIDGNLMFIRGYLSTIGASKRPFSRAFLSDFNHSTANPKVSRFFSTQAPKKKDYEDFYQNRIIWGPKEGGNTDNNSSSSHVTYLGRLKKAAFALFVIELLFAPFSSNPRAGEQISYQEFKNKLLKQGLVDRIVVSNNFILNKSVAKVSVRSSPQNQSRYDTIEGSDSETPVSVTPEGGENSQIQYKYYFNIGSVDSFEEKLDKAQEAMGIDPNDYVPVTYVSEIDCHYAIMLFCLFIWLC
ncbi:hypothetical protein CASFOL_035015 [Castilleja foliolosa]|uniref:Peptidase M41 FtsH extracellular domain-containing protein n=1 Tax=Castilleja foliolosa TaxID=1961234 RepID=A0ABD3BSA8_9LAMI